MWLRAMLRWLGEARYFWTGVAVVAAAALFLFRVGATEPWLRMTGLALQLLGIATVGWGIRQTRILFGRPDFLALARQWLRRFPFYGTRVVSASLGVTSAGSRVSVRGQVTATVADASVKARLDALERNMDYANERISQTQAELDQAIRAHAEAVEQERQARAKEDKELRNMLESTETGGLHISAVGAVWLFVGVTLSTAAPELARWFG
jgi:hypothetical protein